jgi:hypothetical protein
MSNDPKEIAEIFISKNRKPVDRSLRTLMAELEQENTLLPQTASGQFQRLVKVYRNVKPVLTLLSSLALIPTGWRTGLVVLVQTLDSLTLAAPEVTAQFKAGKDL